MKKRFFLLSLLMAVTMMASAAVKTIGQGVGSYDYGSLYEAGKALSTTALTENTVWEICTDLTESMNVGICNNTNFTLTIRPHDATKRTITYTTPSDNKGPSGHVIIGGVTVNTTDNSKNITFTGRTTKNVIIDGSYNDDGARHLEFKGGINAGVVLVIYGDVTSTFVKNCSFINTRTTENTTNYAVIFRTEKDTDKHPDGVELINCYLEAKGTVNSQTVYFNSSQKSTNAGLVANMKLKNCEIVSCLRGVFFNGAKNADFEGCTFRMQNTSAGFLAHGIMGNAQTGTINVKGCKFLELNTKNASVGAYGIHGITASGGATVWNIENNIFTGLDALNANAASKAIEMVAVRCGDPCVVRHNTFIMPSLTKHPTTAITSAYPISLLYLAGSTNTVQNNIFVSNETTSNNSLIRGAMNANCTGNIFYHNGGNAYVVAGAKMCKDSINLEAEYPTQAATSKWVNVAFDANFRLDTPSKSDKKLAAFPIDGITTDILGATRNNPTYAGAEDPGLISGFVEHLYEMGDNQGSWSAEHSIEMTKVAPNIFESTFSFSGDVSYFAFATVQSADWDVVNANRFGGNPTHELVQDGSATNLVSGNLDFSVAPGTYTFRVDLNANKLYVKGHLYEIGDNNGWHANSGLELTRIEAGRYEGDMTFTAAMSSFAFFKALAEYDNVGGWSYINDGLRFAGESTNETIDDGETKELQNTSGVEKQFKILPGVYHVVVDMDQMEVTLTQSKAKVIVGEAGYATYYKGTKAYTMPTGMTGHAFNVANGLVEAYAAGEIVPQATPLVLEAAAGTYDLVFTTGGTPKDLASQLHGSDVDALTSSLVVGDYTFYGLSLNSAGEVSSVGFYFMEDGGAAFTNKAHKAFLAIPVSAGAPAHHYLFNGTDDATDIKAIEGQEKAVKFIENGRILILKDGVTYDAMGRIVR